MLHIIDKLKNNDNVQYTRPAILTRVDEQKMLVRIEYQQASFVIEATNALAVDYQPNVGDELLVSGENFRSCFIIGVLNKVQTNNQISTTQGAVAKSQIKNGHETLSIEDEHGYLLFEYDASEKKSKLYASQGDLSLMALQGNIELVSGKDIHCRSLGSISLDSATATQLRVSSKDEKYSSINLTEKGILLSSERVGVSAEKAEFRIKEGFYEGKNFKCVLERSKAFVGKIETVATRILERATNVYRQVDELEQTKAGRVRTLVKDTYQLNSKTCYIKSEKNVNIDGEKIHLG